MCSFLRSLFLVFKFLIFNHLVPLVFYAHSWALSVCLTIQARTQGDWRGFVCIPFTVVASFLMNRYIVTFLHYIAAPYLSIEAIFSNMPVNEVLTQQSAEFIWEKENITALRPR